MRAMLLAFAIGCVPFAAQAGESVTYEIDGVAALSRELEEAGATYTIEVYSGAPHGFTEWDSDRYQKRADDLSWTAFQNFLATTISE